MTECIRWFVPLLLTAAVAAQTASPPFDLDTAFAAAMPPREESRWTLIPWRHSLTDALVEGKQTRKPVYLFINDGNVESGRC